MKNIVLSIQNNISDGLRPKIDKKRPRPRRSRTNTSNCCVGKVASNVSPYVCRCVYVCMCYASDTCQLL